MLLNQIQNQGTIYSFIESINNQLLFLYIVIIIIFIYFFIKIDIRLNVFLALILAIGVILYINEKEQRVHQIEENILNTKKSAIKPESPHLTNINKDLIDFIFSVQDFYQFNPQAFEEFVDDIDAFLVLSDTIRNDVNLCNYYYQIADTKASNALNVFHSLLYNLPVDPVFTEKLVRAHKRLETILNRYLNELYDLCETFLFQTGYNVQKKQIVIGPKEYNTYFDKDFMFQLY